MFYLSISAFLSALLLSAISDSNAADVPTPNPISTAVDLNSNPCINLPDVDFRSFKALSTSSRESEDGRKKAAYTFCQTIFPGLFTIGWEQAYQKVIENPSAAAPIPIDDELFNKCQALRLFVPEWTVGLLRRRGQLMRRQLQKWKEWRKGEDKLKELIFHACTATFADEPNPIYVDWAEQITMQSECPQLHPDYGKFQEIQSMASQMGKFTTRAAAEEVRKKAVYAFCHALFGAELLSDESKRVETEQWSLSVDFTLVPRCPFAAFLQPEARMMRERHDVKPELRQQLGVFLKWPSTGETGEGAKIKDATLVLCQFTFPLEPDNTTLIVIICSIVGGILFCLLLAALLAVFLIWRRRKILKAEEDVEMLRQQMLMPDGTDESVKQQLAQLEETPQSIIDETCDDSARTVDVQISTAELKKERRTGRTQPDKTKGESIMQTAILPAAEEDQETTAVDSALTRTVSDARV